MSGGSPIARGRKATRRADANRCPWCERKSALSTVVHDGQVVRYCRYDDCTFESATDLTKNQ